jgi:uncharacterized protein (DUF58 family)
MPHRQSILKHSDRSRRLQILSTRLVTSLFAGAYKSVFRGRGIEFEELCEYQPGDDIRSIDWNVTARSGSPFIKRFAEEREMTVMLMLDRSASLVCPSPNRPKHEAAAEVCALLATAAERNNDRIGLLTFGGGIECFIPPGKGSRHVRRLIAEIAVSPAAPSGTDLSGALNYLTRVTRRPLILFVVSDFICADFSNALALVARRHDTVAIALSDPHDLNLPDVGLLQVSDAESGQGRVIDTSSGAVRSAYTRLAALRQSAIRQTIVAAGAAMVPLCTTAHPAQVLSGFFQARQQRARGFA